MWGKYFIFVDNDKNVSHVSLYLGIIIYTAVGAKVMIYINYVISFSFQIYTDAVFEQS